MTTRFEVQTVSQGFIALEARDLSDAIREVELMDLPDDHPLPIFPVDGHRAWALAHANRGDD